MSLSLGGNLSPFPVSTKSRRPPTSMSRQRVVYSQRLSASHETSFDHSVLGTTPCMAPPSRRKFPPFSMVSRASPMVSTVTEVYGNAARASGRGALIDGDAGLVRRGCSHAQRQDGAGRGRGRGLLRLRLRRQDSGRR